MMQRAVVQDNNAFAQFVSYSHKSSEEFCRLQRLSRGQNPSLIFVGRCDHFMNNGLS
jgi:hypothetical protein